MDLDLQTTLGIIALASVGVNVILAVRKPNEKQNLSISSLQKDVGTNTKNINKISHDIEKIKDNHLAHINTRLTKIETLLHTLLNK